jgi:hypothetical protein
LAKKGGKSLSFVSRLSLKFLSIVVGLFLTGSLPALFQKGRKNSVPASTSDNLSFEFVHPYQGEDIIKNFGGQIVLLKKF